MRFQPNSPRQEIVTQDFEILVKLPNDERLTVLVTAEDIFGAKTRAAELHGVTYEDTQILAIIDRRTIMPLVRTS